MPPSRARKNLPFIIFPTPAVLAEAGWLFLFSFLFALFFNLFYVEGIELKYKTPVLPHLQEILKTTTATAYPGWGVPRTHPTKRVTAVPTPTQNQLTRLSLIGAKERFDHKSAVFLDARSPDEYKEGHIPGAIDFYSEDFDKMAPTVLPQLPKKNQEIVAYCHGTNCDLSLQLGQDLTELGYTNVKVFFGGWPEWKKAGYPIQQGSQP
ncbi:MAG: rhodanese-like domain-containing protein [bacterium]